MDRLMLASFIDELAKIAANAVFKPVTTNAIAKGAPIATGAKVSTGATAANPNKGMTAHNPLNASYSQVVTPKVPEATALKEAQPPPVRT